ncbi:hypothetical protein B0G84_3308 [Paraburkholderia sp. BL8N3]|nr:hypothetical protein [Paraburkholderia sp. BL8N3]TCK38005.1 hypothetical protein B0G84_3308 [Paraburkholderia sp. BL8N3]
MTNQPTKPDAAKRRPGRPRKQDLMQSEDDDPSIEIPSPPPDPTTPFPEGAYVDRKGAAKLLGRSLSTLAWLEQHDPDFPAPFTLGRNNFMYFVSDLWAFVIKKRNDALAKKQKQIRGGPNQ